MSLDTTINNKRNFLVNDPSKQEYINSAKLDNLTLNIDSTSIFEIPTTSTTWQNALILSAKLLAASRVIILVPSGQGESYASPKEYFLNIPSLAFNPTNTEDYPTQKRLYNSADKLLWYTEGAYNSVSGHFPIEISNGTFIRFQLPPFTRLIIYAGLIPVGEPNAGTPNYAYSYYNRFDWLIENNHIPGVNMNPLYNPRLPVDQWILNATYTNPNVADPATGEPPYNSTVLGETKWINLPKNGFM